MTGALPGERAATVLTVVGVGAVLLVLPVIAAVGGLGPEPVIGVVIAALLLVVQPDSWRGLASLTIVALLWLQAGAGPSSPGHLGVAVLLFAAHASLALRAAVPPQADLDRALVRCWVVRSAVVLLATAGVYGLVVAVHALPRGGGTVLAAAALAVLAVLALLLRAATLGSDRA